MKELNLGSSYNPNKDPLFHMPWQLRIDAMKTNSSSSRSQESYRRHNGKPLKRISPSGEETFYPIARSAAEDNGISDETLRVNMMKKPGQPYHGYIWEYV